MVGSFRNVNAPRVRFLEIGEAKRLINAAPPDLRNLIQGGLLTGARYGELTRLKCHEFDANSGTIHIRTAKAGIRRDVVLNDEGKKLFESLTAGRSGDSFVFVRSDGEPWGTGHQTRPFNAAVQRAEIKPGITFHGLRHTYASLAIMGGMPLLVVAKNLGHRDTRMVEQHYGHLADDFFAQKVRETAPSYGLGESNVVELDR
jgi:integrase